MTNKWIIEMLTDLHDFAHKNDMSKLATQLADTIQVATLEIARYARVSKTEKCDSEKTEELLQTTNVVPIN